jgi:beta-galactosidase
MNHGLNEGGYADVLDVVGYNYGDKGLAYVKDHEKHPGRIEFCTEATSFISTRGEYQNDWGKGYVSNLGLWQPNWGPLPGESWADIVKYLISEGCLSGQVLTTVVNTPYQWPCVTSHFGFMDICGFPKDG